MRWAPLKRLCEGPPQYGLNVPASEYMQDGIRFLRTTDIREDGSLAEDGAVFVDPSTVGPDHELQDGDLLFSRSGTLGRCLRFRGKSGEASFAGYLIRFRPSPDADPDYLAYCARAGFFTAAIEADAITSTISNFNAERYAGLMVPAWSYDRQRAIAGFLDAETARIDALIAKKRKMLAVLEELRWLAFEIALAAAGVTLPDSVDPERLRNAPLPPDWMGPKLSSVLLQLTNGYVGPTRDILRDEGIRYVQGLHIKRGRIGFERRPYYVEEEWHSAHPRTALRPGDVLIVQTGDIGQVAVVPDGFGPANCHALLIARANPDLVSGIYLGMYFQSRFGYNSLVRVATGALHPHLEFGIRDVPVVVPPRSVQGKVVDEVLQRQSNIDRLMAKLTRQIDLLTERRQALITAAVTGELNVAESIVEVAS